MASVTVTRTFGVPGYARSDGAIYAEPYDRRSAVFTAGGYDWSIRYYPISLVDMESIDLCLQLETKAGSRVTASFGVALLDPTGSLPPWKLSPIASAELIPNLNNDADEVIVTMTKSLLNMAPDPRYLTRGGLLFECTITVFTETTVPMPDTMAAAKAPASDMMEQLGKIYASEDGADVTYSVQGKLFHAHKIILAMRSPVFKAQLYGGIMESTAKLILVTDMLPDVFKALLCYIYTDTLPAPDGQADDDEDVTEVISHLLLAADQYSVERLRILCEYKLCTLVTADNIVKLLVFAEEQHCNMIKDACIEFMATSDRIGKVVASKEYAQLRSTHPLILIDALEKSNKFLKDSMLVSQR
ncbi:BTB/POZ and MATH domain-containing protein 1 [Dichanthelium oligosanthes]|uniref:BTB/POZ and MATH domain-containing protein 1 n=1 Tax=Dichanthelium oligosanthes TaxID=888268 RepID=A0A1E5V887_9POAL|nr:BTB/POZ and MATH domain-containing protein 1 [Dichanthelium oligosanthes]